jgi:hypothetical protein
MLKSGIWIKHIKGQDECRKSLKFDRKGDGVSVKREESDRFELFKPKRGLEKPDNEALGQIDHHEDSIERTGSITCYN